MNITIEHLASFRHDSDFDFLDKIIEELKALPTSERVTFPLPNRQSTYADIEVKLSYDRDDRPQGEFFFVNRRHALEMAHSVVVTPFVLDGKLVYHFGVRPNSRLRRNGHRTSTSVQKSSKAAALAMVRNYQVGLGTRKVIPIIP